jgi:type I restriction enzyme S subunit
MESKKLEDWPIKIIDGDRSSRYPKANEMVNKGVLFLSTPSIVDGTIDASVSNFVTQEKFDSILKGRLEHSDIVMTTRGTIGKLAFFKSSRKYPTGLINAQMLILRPDPEVIRPKYLFYLMGSEKYQTQIKSFSSGSAQPQIPITDLKKTVLSFPKIETQDSIVEVIDKYSNLIENNNRRIAILEDMAQSLYREWFVNFRYPNHKDNVDSEGKPKLIDSPLGQIPVGWKLKPLGELVEFKRKSVKKGRVPEQTPYMGLEHFPRKSIALSDWEEVSEIGSDKLVFSRGDILFGKIRPNFHKVGVAQVDGLCSSDTFVLSPKKPEHHSLIAMVTFSNEFVAQAVQTAQGSKMPRASWDVLQDFTVCVPDANTLRSFNNLVAPAIEQVRVLSLKNRNLKQQRDMLLPKLISGTIKL